MRGTGPAAPGWRGDASGPTSTPNGRRVAPVLQDDLGIVGAIALFLGAFVQFAGENRSAGFFGVWSTRVEDVSEAWKFTLLAGGSLLLGLSFALAALRRSRAGSGGTTAATA
jgi:hypothetical protein